MTNQSLLLAGAVAPYVFETDEELIEAAYVVMEKRFKHFDVSMQNIVEVKTYLTGKLASLEYESFFVMFLTNNHTLIEGRELFKGTVNGASVYPREVVKAALTLNAAAVILAHNHPSGITEPSQADMRITERLVNALELIDVRVVDHFIVGSTGAFLSFAANGLM